MLHFDGVATSSLAKVRHGLDFPDENADGEEEKEAGEKDGEKDEQVDVKLVLAEVDRSEGKSVVNFDVVVVGVGFNRTFLNSDRCRVPRASDGQKESSRSEIVFSFRQ